MRARPLAAIIADFVAGSGRACDAGVAQLVERNLAKVEVESSRLFCRSSLSGGNRVTGFPRFTSGLRIFAEGPGIPGGVAEWLCSGLQSRVRRFDSDPRLQLSSEVKT